MLTRRRLLRSAATFAAAVGGESLLPANVLQALAQAPHGDGSLCDIKHIVLLMQENRSFDHYLGIKARCLARWVPGRVLIVMQASIGGASPSVSPA